MLVYLDHNIIDDISKGRLSLKPSGKVTWVYSDENLAEIQRSQNMRFLDVLNSLKASKLELMLDSSLRLTGQARILEYQPSRLVYDEYLQNISEVPFDQSHEYQFLAGLFGADHNNELLEYPRQFKESIKSLLEDSSEIFSMLEDGIDTICEKLEGFVSGDLQNIDSLEQRREVFGMHGGRASNLANKGNPIEELWQIVRPNIKHMTADQFFGFEQLYEHYYEKLPIYLGIVGCHTVLNALGFRPDKGLSKAECIQNILSDGRHIANGAFCQVLLSRDRKLLDKASAIYKYKNIGTVPVTYTKTIDSAPTAPA